MNDFTYSNPRSEDKPAMLEIWQTVFGIEDASLFFETIFKQDLSLVSKHNDEIVAMGHVLPVGELVINQTEPIPTGMIYAVSTKPEYRKHGLGTSISKQLIHLARSHGYPAVVLCPAHDGLFDFYEKRTSMKEWFYINEFRISSPSPAPEQVEFLEVSPLEYMELRNGLLSSIAHIRFNLDSLEYQRKLCRLFDGGLYRIKSAIGDSCITIERQSPNEILIKELIMPNICDLSYNFYSEIQNIVAIINLVFPADEFIVRTPVKNNQHKQKNHNINHKTIRFAMLSMPDNHDYFATNKTNPPWYGLAYD